MKKILILFAIVIASNSLLAQNNVITYTAPTKLVETTNTSYYGLHTDAFNVAIVSHTFADGTGTITFAEDVTSIGFSAFYCCSSLISISIPNSVTSIGASAFYDCSGLTSIEIPSSVTLIGDRAFCGCSTLTSIDIPNSVTSIGLSAFEGCFSLTSIYIPESVTSIGDWAFSHCSGLTSIEIPNSVTHIGHDAFSGCSGLTSITCFAMVPPSLEEDVFNAVPRDIPLYVPASSIPLYQAAEQWGEFDIQPYLIEIEPVAPNTTELTWNPVDSASLYQLHLYTDSTSSVALDTTLQIIQPSTSVARRVKKIIQDAGGTIIVITIDPTSGTSEENPYKVTVSTVSGERIDVHFDMTVFQGTEILREESGSFVLNDVQPEAIENTLAPNLPTGIYDLYGHRYPAEAWETLPAGVYVVREDNKVEKMMKK